MTKAETGASTFGSGFNCAQAVFSTFSGAYGLDGEAALKIAGGFGSGARAAELCGAVSGALLVIGLKHGQADSTDADAKQKCNAEAEAFHRRFRTVNGSIVCRDLLECDIMTADGREAAVLKGLFKTKCTGFVVSAIQILQEMGY